MANPAHLKILKQGVDVWNRWRKENPDVVPELRGADLEGIDLSESVHDGEYIGANLVNADLRCAHLSAAKLQGVDLRNSDLRSANVTRATFGCGDLSGASLWGAQFTGANLEGTRIGGADMGGFQEFTVKTKVILDGVHLGNIAQVVSNRSLAGIEWLRVHVGRWDYFEPNHDMEDKAYWLISEGRESIHEAYYRRRFSGQAMNDITVEFSRAVWRELHLVEMGLREALGEGRFTIQKADDHLAVTFESPEDLQRGFEAVIVQLAALESVESQRVKSMIVRPLEGDVQVLGPADVELGDIAARMERLEEMMEQRLPAEADFLDASVEHAIDKIPGANLFTPALAWLYRQSRDQFKLLRRRREESTIVGERRLLKSAPSEAEDTSED